MICAVAGVQWLAQSSSYVSPNYLLLPLHHGDHHHDAEAPVWRRIQVRDGAGVVGMATGVVGMATEGGK